MKPEPSARAFAGGTVVIVATLPAEEAVEEVLHVTWGLLAVVVTIWVVWLGYFLRAAFATSTG